MLSGSHCRGRDCQVTDVRLAHWLGDLCQSWIPAKAGIQARVDSCENRCRHRSGWTQPFAG